METLSVGSRLQTGATMLVLWPPAIFLRSARACQWQASEEAFMDGSRKTMAERNVGDSVRVGKNEFSRVFMFTHKVFEGTKSFVTIGTAEGQLELTAGHYLYVNGALSSAGA